MKNRGTLRLQSIQCRVHEHEWGLAGHESGEMGSWQTYTRQKRAIPWEKTNIYIFQSLTKGVGWVGRRGTHYTLQTHKHTHTHTLSLSLSLPSLFLSLSMTPLHAHRHTQSPNLSLPHTTTWLYSFSFGSWQGPPHQGSTHTLGKGVLTYCSTISLFPRSKYIELHITEKFVPNQCIVKSMRW